jgi:hypothetical protein
MRQINDLNSSLIFIYLEKSKQFPLADFSRLNRD